MDLYQQVNQSVSDSPPQMPPSKTSPTMKRAATSPVTLKTSPGTNNISVKVCFAKLILFCNFSLINKFDLLDKWCG